MNPYDEFIINGDEGYCFDPRHYHKIIDPDYKKRLTKEREIHDVRGDCYEKNYEAFWDIYHKTKNKNLKYVIAYLRYKKTGNKIIHAFLLDGDDMIDRSQGKNIRVSFEEYQKYNADITMSKTWDMNTIPRWEGIINRFESYDCLANAEVRFDQGIKKQIGSWDLGKLEVL